MRKRRPLGFDSTARHFNMNKRPLSATIIGWLYIITGAMSAVFHAAGFKLHPFAYDVVFVELVNLAANAGGAYVLLGRNWARWLVIGWMAFHVVVSAFHSVYESALHALFLAILAYLLLRPAASRYFQRTGPQAAA